MFACCGRPAAASLGDPFTYIVSTMRVKRSPKAARWGPPSRRRPLVRQAPGRPTSVSPAQNQHSHNQRQNQCYHAARKSQSHPFALEDGQLRRTHIAFVLADSQNTCIGEGLRTVPFIVSEISQRHRTTVPRPQLTQ